MLFDHLHFKKISSTQNYVRDNADDLVLEDKWLVVTADTQSNGRGTHNRQWASPPNVNIYATFALDLAGLIGSNQQAAEDKQKELFEHPIIVQSAALAVVKTLEHFGFKPTIKWRNDVLLNKKKVCGILCEPIITPSGRNIGLIGIGLNVNMEQKICDDLDQPVTSMAIEAKRNFDKEEVFEILSIKLANCIHLYSKDGFTVFRDELIARMDFVSEKIKVKNDDKGGEIFEGIFKGIDDTGRLILELPNKQKMIVRTGGVLRGNPQHNISQIADAQSPEHVRCKL